MSAVHNSWLLGDLKSNDILMGAFDTADLEVDFNVGRDPRSMRAMAIIDHNFMCVSRVRFGANMYFCKFQEKSGDQRLLDKGHLTTG